MTDAPTPLTEGNDSADLPPAKPAATLVVFDETGDGPPRLLMVRRSTAMAFAGGAVVFPGGRVDPDDHVTARRHAGYDDDVDDIAARVAAIRETLEETGLLVAADRPVATAIVAAMRDELAAGAPFSALLVAHGIDLDLGLLLPFARWNPQLNSHRRFDTRFYLARAPEEHGALSVDGAENSLLFWASAAGTLDLAALGRIELIFPTRRNLERLAGYRDFDAAALCAARHGTEVITPWIEQRSDGRYLVIPAERGYPVTAERLDTASRG